MARAKPGPKAKEVKLLPVTAGRPEVCTGDDEVDRILTALYDATDGFGWSCVETALMAVQFAHLYVETERARVLYRDLIKCYKGAHATKEDILDAQRAQGLWMDLFKELRVLGGEFGLTPQAISRLPKANASRQPIKAIAVDGKDEEVNQGSINGAGVDMLQERGL